MKRFILALAVGLCTLGVANIASAHPPRCEPVRVYHRGPVCAPEITCPAPVCAPVVVPACETIVRPIYHYHHEYYRGHYRR
jgi:hypothetical protein